MCIQFKYKRKEDAMEKKIPIKNEFKGKPLSFLNEKEKNSFVPLSYEKKENSSNQERVTEKPLKSVKSPRKRYKKTKQKKDKTGCFQVGIGMLVLTCLMLSVVCVYVFFNTLSLASSSEERSVEEKDELYAAYMVVEDISKYFVDMDALIKQEQSLIDSYTKGDISFLALVNAFSDIHKLKQEKKDAIGASTIKQEYVLIKNLRDKAIDVVDVSISFSSTIISGTQDTTNKLQLVEEYNEYITMYNYLISRYYKQVYLYFTGKSVDVFYDERKVVIKKSFKN